MSATLSLCVPNAVEKLTANIAADLFVSHNIFTTSALSSGTVLPFPLHRAPVMLGCVVPFPICNTGTVCQGTSSPTSHICIQHTSSFQQATAAQFSFLPSSISSFQCSCTLNGNCVVMKRCTHMTFLYMFFTQIEHCFGCI